MKINKVLKYIIELIALIACVAILLINLAYNVSLENIMAEIINVSHNEMFRVISYIITIIAIYYIWYKSDLIKIKPKTKKILLVVLFVVYFIIQILWINVRQANPNYDQYYVYDTAVRMKEENENLIGDEYLEVYPQQISTASFYALILKIFNTNDVKILQYLNAIANTFTILGLYFITKKIANKNNSVNKLAFVMLAFTFTALPLLSTFVYGDFISLPFAIFAIYFVIKYAKENKLRYLFLSAVLMSISYFLRMNMLIFMVAISIYLILELIKFISEKIKEKNIKAKKKILDSALKSALVIIFVLISIMPTNLYKSYMQSKLQLDKGRAFPAIGHLTIGIHRSGRGYGWYADDLGGGWQTGEITKEDYKQDFKDRLNKLTKDPTKLIYFYTNKLASMWAEITFGSFWYNLSFNFRNMQEGYFTASEEQIIEYQNVDKELLKFYNFDRIYEKILVLLLFLGVLLLILRNNDITNEQILLILVFIGGFLFHFMWEAKSRYVIPYVVILIPIASIGIKENCEWIKASVKKIKEKISPKNKKKQEG